jgi:hypothetical protein
MNNFLKQNKEYDEKRCRANQEIAEFIIEYAEKHPYLRFGQIVATLKLDNFNEEPWVMFDRIRREENEKGT